MRISDWSSDVCSSDLQACPAGHRGGDRAGNRAQHAPKCRKLQGTGNFKERAGKERGSREKPGEVGEGRGSGLAAGAAAQRLGQIGRAHVRTPVTNAHLVCRLLLEKKNKRKNNKKTKSK